MNREPVHSSMLLALAAILLVLSRAGAAVCEYIFPMRDLMLANARIESGAIVPMRTYHHAGEGELWMEAESASAITAPVEHVKDKAPSGGAYLHIPDRTYRGRAGTAVFSVTCAKAGTYRFWVRTFRPDIGSNSFYLGLDNEDESVFGNTEGPGQLKRWFWLAAEPWRLSQGAHKIVLRWREDGTRLDKVVLTAREDFAPTGLGSQGAMLVLPKQMAVTTGDCRPPRAVRWTRVLIRGEALPQSTRVEASTDRGRTWQTVGADGALDGLAAKGDGSDQIRCRVTVPKPRADSAITDITITYEGAPSFVAIENERVAIVFDVTNGSAASILNKASSPPRFALRGTGARPLALRYFNAAEKKVETVPADAIHFEGHRVSKDAERSTILLRYRAVTDKGELLAKCSVVLPSASHVSTWRIEVENATKSLELVDVEFPVLSGVRIGKDAKDDWLIWPAWGGGHRIPDPASHAPGRGKYLGGTGTMNWLDVHDDAQGLYLASCDKTLLTGSLRAESWPGMPYVTLSMSKMPRVEPGGAFRSEPFVVAAHSGDWHWAADQYRTWIQSWMTPYRPPQWLVESDGWLGRGRGTNFLKDIPAAYRFARELGLNHVEFWGQMMAGRAIGGGGCNRLYFPDPRYGTEADFAKAIRYVRDAGGHIGFYTNGQAWNPRYPKLRPEYEGLLPANVLIPDWERGFNEFALIRPDGSFVPQYPKPPDDDSPYPCLCYLMCAHAKGWQDYLYHYIVEKYVRQYGVDHMYVDQLGAAPAQWCFARGHGHDDHVGAWTRGNMEKFRRFKEDGRKTEPDFSLSTEGFGDVYGQYVDAFLISPASTRAWPYSAPEVVRYTFPEYICIDGFANGNKGGGPGEEVVYKVFLMGNRFDLFCRPGSFADFCKRVIRLRQETAVLLYRGTFRDDVGLSVSDPRVRAKLWRLDTADAKGWLVNFYNPAKVASARVRVQTGDGRVARAFIASFDSITLAPCPFESQDAAVTVAVPNDVIGTVLLLERSKPCLLRAWCALAAAGAGNRVELRFRPLAKGIPSTGTARVMPPKGWQAQPATFDTSVSRDVALPFTIPANASPGGYEAKVHCSIGSLEWEKALGLVVVERFEASMRAEGRNVIVRVANRSADSASGDCRISADAPLQISESKAAHVPSHGEAEVVFEDVRPPKLKTKSEVGAVFECDGVRARAAMIVGPPDLSAENWRHSNYERPAAYSIERAGSPEETLMMESSYQACRAAWQWRSNSLSVGTAWTFSAECRTHNVVSKDKGAWVRIIFFHRTKANKAAAPWVVTKPIVGTQDWTPIRCEFTVPPETGAVQIELFLHHASGKARWRKLRLE